MIKIKNSSITKRFWSKVRVTKHPKKCWEWMASKNRYGYGQIMVGGRSGRPMLSHRVSWVIHNGPIPQELGVLHRCDNPGCVRPGHLYLGTQKENMRDCRERGRMAVGDKLPQAILTARQVIGIRDAFRKLRESMAKKYKVSTAAIGSIVSRTRWKHLWTEVE